MFSFTIKYNISCHDIFVGGLYQIGEIPSIPGLLRVFIMDVC